MAERVSQAGNYEPERLWSCSSLEAELESSHVFLSSRWSCHTTGFPSRLFFHLLFIPQIFTELLVCVRHYSVSLVLNQEWHCSPGSTFQCLGTLLVVRAGMEVLLASRARGQALLSIPPRRQPPVKHVVLRLGSPVLDDPAEPCSLGVCGLGWGDGWWMVLIIYKEMRDHVRNQCDGTENTAE